MSATADPSKPTDGLPAGASVVRFGGRAKTATLALLAFAMLIVSLDQYIVVVALPEIGRELEFTAQTLQAVISAYAVASAGFLLLGGRASDLLGRRRVFVDRVVPVRRRVPAGRAGVRAGGAAGLTRRCRAWAGRWCSRPRSRWSTPPSPRAASATARWPSGAAPGRPGW